MQDRPRAIEQGAENLLVNGASVRGNDRLLIVREEPGLGYYDEEIVSAIAVAGRRLGAAVTVVEAPFDPQASELPAEVRDAMAGADRTVFLARIGDQLRFCDTLPKGRMLSSSSAFDLGAGGCERPSCSRPDDGGRDAFKKL